MPAPNNRKCQIQTCGRKHWAKGFCNKHYLQVRNHGHVLTGNYLSKQGKRANAARKNTHNYWSDEAKRRNTGKHLGFRRNTGRTHFKKGHKTWNTGISDCITPEHRKKMVENIPRGENHSRWKGGITSEDRKERIKFRQQLHSKILTRDNYTCQICDVYGNPVQIDHIKSWSKYPELRFDPDNCRTLCMACHYYVTFKRKLPQGVIWGHNLSRRIES